MPLIIDRQNNVNTAGSATQNPANPQDKKLQALRKSCREFEAIYIQEMYKAMRKTVPDSGLFEKKMSSDLYKEMLDMEMAKTTAAGKGIGLGEAMYQQMKDKIDRQK